LILGGTTYNVSNSEATDFGSCQWKWMLAHHGAFNLESKAENVNFYRGTVVHSVLEAFFRPYAEGADYDKCVIMAKKQLHMERLKVLGDADNIELYAALKPLQEAFDLYFVQQKATILTWEILGIELLLSVPMSMGTNLTGRIDLLVRPRSGPFKGETIPVDHKTCYNFWSDAEMQINSQMPLYGFLVKHHYPDHVIQRAFINNVRWREVKDDAARSKIQVFSFTRKYQQTIIDNHERLSRHVAAFRDMPIEDVRDRLTRTVNPYTCKNCSLRKLCLTQLQGGDEKSVIENDYQPNSYGYGNDKMETFTS
jgi:hypothetical protein